MSDVRDPGQLPPLLSLSVDFLPRVQPIDAQNKDKQSFTIAVDMDGVINKGQVVTDGLKEPEYLDAQAGGLDIFMIIDNGYYVSDTCLEASVKVADEIFGHLMAREKSHIKALEDANIMSNDSGDRLAIVFTHCSHDNDIVKSCIVRGLYPVFGNESAQVQTLRESAVCRALEDPGHQLDQDVPKVFPPSMETMIRAALETLGLRNSSRSHVIVLSPRFGDLQQLLDDNTLLQVHQVNTAPSPYHTPGSTFPFQARSTSAGYNAYVSPIQRVKQVLGYARCEKPAGAVTDLVVEFISQPGCTVTVPREPLRLGSIQLGQRWSFFVSVEVEPQSMKTKDLFTMSIRHKQSIHVAPTQLVFHKSFSIIPQAGNLEAEQEVEAVELVKRMAFYHARSKDYNTARERIAGLLHVHQAHPACSQVCSAALEELDYQEKVKRYEGSGAMRERWDIEGHFPVCLRGLMAIEGSLGNEEDTAARLARRRANFQLMVQRVEEAE